MHALLSNISLASFHRHPFPDEKAQYGEQLQRHFETSKEPLCYLEA